MRRLALPLLVLSLVASACSKEDPKPAPSTLPSSSATPEATPSAPIATVTPPPSPVAIPMKVGYARYTNPRFGFAVDYPTFIKLEAPPENGDGQTFTYFDKISMKTWGIHNVGNDTIETLAKDAAKDQVDPKDDPKKANTYQQKSKDGFVVSGTRGSKIFYLKEKLVDGVVYAVLLEYDTSVKLEMGPIVTHVAESFTVMGQPKK
ncbi:MAG: hypothetical protein JWM74_2843 [Myxococcaceae bacterium]|nr:hypothetical protein [Myxococcaceae bacterium]